jgi:hypothetical protein
MLFFAMSVGELGLSQVYAADQYSAAVLNFSAKDRKNPELGGEVAMLLTAFLSEFGELSMVERQELETVMSEQALGLSGTINSETAAQIGQLVGADIIISGSIMSLGKEKNLIAKIMGIDTGRVFAVPVKVGPSDSMSDACMTLAQKINDKVSQKGSDLVAEKKSARDFIAQKKEEIQGKELPTVTVSISEVHIGQPVPDPAAQTEVAYILQQLGFTIIDINKSSEKPNIEIAGEAFSEKGITRGDLISCKARIEIKAVDLASGKILAVDRQTETAVEASEHIAGKTALQNGAAKIVERMVDKLIQ